MLINVPDMVQPDPKDLNWITFDQLKSEPGGRWYVGNGQFIDSEGNSLDPASQLNDLDEAIAKLEAQKKDLEARKASVKTDKVDDKKVEPVVAPVVSPVVATPVK